MKASKHEQRRAHAALTLVWLAFSALDSLGADAAQRGKPPSTNELAPRAIYMRVASPTSNTLRLEIALRKFVPAGRAGPVIWLAGASHIGDTNYFRALQRHLDAQSLVLFEGIKDGFNEFPKNRKTATPKGPPEDDEAAPGSIQSTLASSLGLAFQLDAIDYDRPHFHNSDVSLGELQRLMFTEAEGKAEAAGAPGEFAKLMQVMDGSSMLGALLQAGLNLLGTSAKLQALTKVMLIETLGQVKVDLSQMRGLPAELDHMLKVLIQARNRVVLDDLKTELNKRNPARSISIFYGAGHMDHLEKQLCQELKYRAAEDQWLAALSVDLGEAGVSNAELEMIRALVKWQMQTLQP